MATSSGSISTCFLADGNASSIDMLSTVGVLRIVESILLTSFLITGKKEDDSRVGPVGTRFRTCFDFLLWAPHEYFLTTFGALRAASMGWGRRSCPWCKSAPIYLRQSGFALVSARSPGGRRSCLLCYEPCSWSHFRHIAARSRLQTKTQKGS